MATDHPSHRRRCRSCAVASAADGTDIFPKNGAKIKSFTEGLDQSRKLRQHMSLTSALVFQRKTPRWDTHARDEQLHLARCRGPLLLRFFSVRLRQKENRESYKGSFYPLALCSLVVKACVECYRRRRLSL